MAAAGSPASPCGAALFAGDFALFAFMDGNLQCGSGGYRTRAHSALLAAQPVGDEALLTSGEDGRVCRTDASGEPVEVAAIPRKWIPSVAAGPGGVFAFAAGRSAWVVEPGGRRTEHPQDRTVADVALSPDGRSLAVARLGGVRLHALAGDAPPAELAWKGMFAGLSFSPDGRFLVAFMQDGLVHGWRLAEARRPAQHFRMTGYDARVRHWSWSPDCRWLATAGAATAIVWPFSGDEGPMNASAIEAGGVREGVRVTAVACRPGRSQVAVGYGDGSIVLAGIEADEERVLRGRGEAAISALSWHNSGSLVAFGSERGECGVIDVPR